MNIYNKFASKPPGKLEANSEKRIKNGQCSFSHLWVSFFFVYFSSIKKKKIPENHIVNIPTIFDSNLPGGFREEY